MCGISGIFCFSSKSEHLIPRIDESLAAIKHRGPDHTGSYKNSSIALGHQRLSIIDTSDAGNQPFIDESGRYVLVYNGEFYNYLHYRKQLQDDGIVFKSNSDTEVLLQLLIKHGKQAIEMINGCFAFAFLDVSKNQLLLACDRFGINPLHYYHDDDKFVFGSELAAIFPFDVKKEIDKSSAHTYFQLNYIPPPKTIYQGVRKLEPGCLIEVKPDSNISTEYYYKFTEAKYNTNTNEKPTETLYNLLEQSVNDRLIADVPVGSFLSGGIDSSIITAIASKIHPNINTYSMGFKGEEYYDETKYAEIIAKKFNTNHTSYRISHDDLLNHLNKWLPNIDEPFADSSALAVSVLSSKTRATSKVALSGDGADELFGGYNKHRALMLNQKYQLLLKFLSWTRPFLKTLHGSRKSNIKNKIRQIERLLLSNRLNPKERYWFLAAFQEKEYIDNLLKNSIDYPVDEAYQTNILAHFDQESDELLSTLKTDVRMVLPGDMLTKVDRMSMRNGLEVRVPFLDHRLVEFAFSLPTNQKTDIQSTKKILRTTFREFLPEELLNRPKHGFEVPLDRWFKNDLRGLIVDDLFSEDLINAQGIFNYEAIQKLKQSLDSKNAAAYSGKIWNILVFNQWWKNNFS